MSYDVTLRVPQQNDPIDDSCAILFTNPRTVAILDINGISIPLSMGRLENLIDQVKKFDDKVFCYKCDNFIMSESGWNYGGSCKLIAKNEYGIYISKHDAGYIYCVDCMHSCEKGIPKKISIKDKFNKAVERRLPIPAPSEGEVLDND